MTHFDGKSSVMSTQSALDPAKKLAIGRSIMSYSKVPRQSIILLSLKYP